MALTQEGFGSLGPKTGSFGKRWTCTTASFWSWPAPAGMQIWTGRCGDVQASSLACASVATLAISSLARKWSMDEDPCAWTQVPAGPRSVRIRAPAASGKSVLARASAVIW